MRILGEVADATPHIRDFDLAIDVPALVTLFGQLGYETTEDALRNRAVEGVNDPATKVFIAEEQAHIVGVLVVHVIAPWHEPTCWAVVSALVVDERSRGNGAGALLLSESEQFARSLGCSHIELSSSEARIRAHAFYERFGFTEVRKRFVKSLLGGVAS